MYEICVYQIEIKGHMDEEEFFQTGPFRIATTRVRGDSSLFSVCTDQSGIIGLLRHLHGRGFVLLSIERERRIPEISISVGEPPKGIKS